MSITTETERMKERNIIVSRYLLIFSYFFSGNQGRHVKCHMTKTNAEKLADVGKKNEYFSYYRFRRSWRRCL